MSENNDNVRPTRHLRLQVDLVLEIDDADELTAAALERLAGDTYLPADERARAQEAVRRDEAEALAYLIDPFDLVNAVAGVELVQASWNSSHVEYDPDDEEWDLYEDSEDSEDSENSEDSEGEPGDGDGPRG